MQMTFRWYGDGNDDITPEMIRQIPGVGGLVWALHDKQPGEIWTVEEIEKVRARVEGAGFHMDVVESVNVHDDIKIGEFRQRIENNEFLEYEEVYKDRYYGTLKAQVEKQLKAGQNVVFDVDVVGGCNIKKFYGDRALSVFIQPPSVEELRCRLEGRGTDAPEVIESRIAKAEYELGFAPQFDCVIVNDNLETAKAEALKVIKEFLEQ